MISIDANNGMMKIYIISILIIAHYLKIMFSVQAIKLIG